MEYYNSRIPKNAIIELLVRNHPGTMSHITGLFSRRAFNLHTIVCAPDPRDSRQSRMLLLLADEPNLRQVEAQLRKLHDVLELRLRHDLDADLLFARIQETLFAN